MKAVAIYARVSSEQQQKEKTIESQLAELRSICSKTNVVKEYIDNGWSGSTLARPALDELRDDAKKGLWQTLYVYSADRLGRDHIDQGIVLRELRKEGIEVIFRDRPLTEENKLQTDIESLLAEHEKRQFIERTRRGKIHKAKQGKLIHSKPPYGYEFYKDENNDWKLKIKPEEAKIIKLIFKLYFQYQSIRRIADELLKRGIKTRNDCLWRPIRVRDVLTDETYIGQWHYGKSKRIEPKTRTKKFYKRVNSSRRIAKDWVKISIPAIISEEEFESAQRIIEKNYKVYGTTKEIYLLSGVLWCDKCGSRMVGITNRKRKASYYRCSSQCKFPRGNCSAKGTRKKDLEDAVWFKVKEAMQNPEVLIRYVAHLEDGDRNKNLLLEEKEDIIKKQKEIKKKKDKLFELYEMDEIDKEQLSERIGNYSQAEKELIHQLKEIEVRLSQSSNKDIMIKNLREFSKLTRAQLDSLKPQQIKDFLKIVLDKVVFNIDTKELRISGHIPIIEPQKAEEMMDLPVATLVGSSARSYWRINRSFKKVRSG